MLANEIIKEQKRKANRWRLTAITLLLVLALVVLGLVGAVTGRFGDYIIVEKASPTVTTAVVKVKENG